MADIIGGGTPTASDESNFAEKGGIPWLTPADLSDFQGSHVERGRRSLSEKGYSGSGARLLPAGSVLFSSRAPIGYCVVARNPISTNQGFKSFVLRSAEIEPEYIRHYLISAKDYAESVASGTTFKELSGARAAELFFPIAPLNEQRRIVAKLDAIFEQTRAAKARLERLPALLDKLKRSILAAAFRGDLTADWRAAHPDVEPASALLASIRGDRRSRWEDGLRSKGKDPKKATYDEPAGIDLEALPQLPKSWCWATVHDIAAFVTDGTHQPPPTTPTGIPFIGIRNIVDGRIDWDSIDRWVSADTHKALTSRFRATTGDTLYATVGATFGQAVLVEDDREFVFQRHIAHVRAAPQINPSYLAACLGSPHCFAQARQAARGAAQPTVNLGDLRSFAIALPPLSEQQLVVDRATDAMDLVRRLASRNSTVRQAVERLEHSALARAFRGELVEQDPTDEPASALLDRLRNNVDVVQPRAARQPRSPIRRAPRVDQRQSEPSAEK